MIKIRYELKEECMKKSFFLVLCSMVLFGVYGQQRDENRWIIGRWVGEYVSWDERRDAEVNRNFEIILNDNGTGRIIDITGESLRRITGTTEIVFSISSANGSYFNNAMDHLNVLLIFSSNGKEYLGSYFFIRINDQRMIFHEQEMNLTKRN